MLNAHLENKITLKQLVNLLVKNPVQIYKLQNKGKIAVGYDADLTIYDPHKKSILTNEKMASKSSWTPFNKKELKGSVEMTVVGGCIVMNNGEILLSPDQINKKPINTYF